MDRLFLTLFCLCALSSLTRACLFRDTGLCPDKHPLVFGGLIQPQDPNDPLWENGRKVFVFQPPPLNSHGHMGSRWGFDVSGSRGVIQIGTKTCTGSLGGSPVCPVTYNSNLPCRLRGNNPCNFDPLSFANITSSGVNVQRAFCSCRHILQIRQVGGGGGNFQNITAGLQTFNEDVDGLKPDTTYEFRLVPMGDPTPGEFGQLRLQIIRTLCGVPATPTLSLRENTVTSRSAVFQYEFPADEDEPWKCGTISIYFQMENEQGQWENIQNMSTTDDYVNKSGLLPCTDYQFRIKLENNDEETFSNTVVVETDIERLGKVRDLQVETQDENGQLLVTWDPPENADNCRILMYDILVQLIRTESCEHNQTSDKGNLTVNTTSTMLHDLEPYSKFYVRVKPFLKYGGDVLEWNGAYGTTKSVSPIGLVSPSLKENYTSERSLTFSWEESGLECEQQLGTNFGYECVLYELNTGNPVFAESKNVSEESCTFSNLKACGEYSCKVRPVNDGNKGELSSPVNGNISSAALGAIRNISVTQDNRDVKVHWLPPDDSSNLCPVTGFKLNYTLQRHEACSRDTNKAYPPITTNETFYLMQNLSSFTTYKINIAVDIPDVYVGSNPATADKVFTTRSAAPSETPTIDYSRPTHEDIRVRWKPVNCTKLNGIFKQYTFGGNATTGAIHIHTATTRRFIIPNLRPCTFYSFTLKVVNDIGGGPISETFNKTTATPVLGMKTPVC